ncbi:MAG: hypothetical protein ACOZJZ_23950, partial [Pseudomonadota bacterium]
DGGRLLYHPGRHSGISPRVSAIARNAVRDQLGMGVRDQRNAQLRVWLAGAWYLTNQKHGVSALGLQRVLGLGG